MAEKVHVAELRVEDLADLADFYSEQTGRTDRDRGEARRHLHWYSFENPATSDEIPKGWIARTSDGRVVGAKQCTPQRFQCEGRIYTLLHGGGYYVDVGHRGLGLVLMRRFLGVGDHYAHFAATMNEVSGALYERYGGYPIPRTDAELVAPVRWEPLLEEALTRRGAPAAVARAAAQAGRLRRSVLRGPVRGSLTRIGSPDEVPGTALPVPARHAHELTAVRDPGFVRWRYFAGPDTTRALYRYDGVDGSCWVGVNRRRRGARAQIRALMILDLWGELPAGETTELAAALTDRHDKEVDALVFRGMPAERERALCERGAIRRALPRAVGVCIDRSGVLPTRDWYLVPADGDMGH